jgi:hypothetical protein
MQDRFTKVVLSGILVCLILIAVKSNDSHISVPVPMVSVESNDRFVQLAPNIIGIMDKGTNSGKEQLVIFKYDEEANSFEWLTTLDYSRIFAHPDEYGLK